jgi:RNA polymerase sigma-70 factor, ECF subfamily
MNVPAKECRGDSDGELLNAIAAGDCRALEKLCFSYQRSLGRFLSRFTQCRENIEEIINDTFMVVWRSADKFRWESKVSSRIFGIAHRTALKSIRRQCRSAARILGEWPVQTVDPVLEAEIRDWVRHGLNRLPDEQRLTLELAYYMGYSLLEIASMTNAPVGTVKARMFLARQKLRQHLPLI